MFQNFIVPSELLPSDPRFGVGPSLIPLEHVENLLKTGKALLGTGHRQTKVRSLCREVQEGLGRFFDLPAGYEVIMGNGGATFLFDMIGLGLVEKSSAHFVTGEFSNKWFRAHDKIPWISAEKYEVEPGKGINPVSVDGADTICCTLNETSTGVLISELPSLGDDTLLAVDATSGAGQIKVDFKKVDVYFFSPQKVFASEGGLYIAILSPKALRRAEKLYTREEYFPEIMSWKYAIENSLKNQTYNTPAISTIFLLNEQIKLMNKLGENEVVQLSKRRTKIISDWVREKDYLSFFVEKTEFRSTSVATIDIDEKYPVKDLSLRLRELGVAIDIDAYRKLGRNQFRISLFHNVKIEDIKKLMKIISLAIESERKNKEM